MSEKLDRQLQAYHQCRPQMLAENRLGWALVAREGLVQVFKEFDEAASFADRHYPSEAVLIRHTSEQRGVAPFIVARR